MSDAYSSARTVAIVGNSAEIARNQHGEKIDGCDRVIRLNAFRLDGLWLHVGTRVDIVGICLAPFIVRNVLSVAEHRISEATEIWTPSWRGEASGDEVAAAMSTIGRPVEDLVYADEDGDAESVKRLYSEFYERALLRPGPKTMAESGKWLLPTTGFVILHLARRRFSRARLFITGFGLSGDLSPERLDMSGVPMWLGHDLATERQMLLEGIDKGQWEKM